MKTKLNRIRSTFILAFAALMLASSQLQVQAIHETYRYNRRDVSQAAQRLEIEAERLHHLAYQRMHHGTKKEAMAVGRLYTLAEQAEYFSDIADRRRQRRGDIEYSYENVLKAWERAERSYRGLHPTPEVARQFRRTAFAMEDLQSILGRR